MTHKGDVNLTKFFSVNDPVWMDSMWVAEGVVRGSLHYNPVPGADSYHDISIDAPYWADPTKFVKHIGRLRFFDLDEDYER